MKKNTSTSCVSGSCCYRPDWGMWILRLAVAALFFFPGLNKLMDPIGFQGMLEKMMGLSGAMMVIVFWLVVAFELLGAVAVILGKLVPKMVYKIALLGQAVILATALFVEVIPAARNPMEILFHVLGIASIFSLIMTSPFCPFNISGDKEMAGKTK